jgi:uncharacterized MnhB-related membrane protein
LKDDGKKTTDWKFTGFLLFVGVGSLLISLQMILTKAIEGSITEASLGYAIVVALMLTIAVVFMTGGIRELAIIFRDRDNQ